MEIGPKTYHNEKRPVPLDAFGQRYVRIFNKYPSRTDFEFQYKLINEQV